MANSLYLEWFSEANGRVVIESADYELNISAPEWRMTPEEDEQRAAGRLWHGRFHAKYRTINISRVRRARRWDGHVTKF
jgi:hypothetical protein